MIQKIVNMLFDDPELADCLKRIVEFEERESAKGDRYIGFEWYEVGAAPQTLNNLVVKGILRVTFRSNKSTYYTLVDREAVKRALEIYESSEVKVEESVEMPSDLFSIIELHDDKKEIIMRALRSDRPVHVLLVGEIGSAKSLFLLELSRLPRSEYVLGSSLTKAGIVDLMFERAPRYLIIDEIDKVGDRDNVTALLSLMESGIISEAKYKRRREGKFKTWVFGGANYMHRIPPELLSRFVPLHFKPYTPDEYVQVATNVLIKREGLAEDVAEYIAISTLKKLETRDVRDAVKVARLSRGLKDEVDRVIDLLIMNKPRRA